MELYITENKNNDVLKIIGRIDSYTSPKIQKVVRKLINEGHNNFVIDLSEVNYLSSSGILLFVNLQKKLSKQGDGKIVFSQVPDLIFSNIKLAGFDKFFKFYNDKNTAEQSF